VKRPRARQQAARDKLLRELLPAGIAVGIGLASLVPIIVMPELFGLTLLLAMAISLFGFVRGCMRAAREGNFVAFDYLEFLGPLRWLIAVGFFGMYLMGYLALWTFVQIRCAVDRPKAMLPWFGVQAFGVVLVFLGVITAGISNQMWKTIRPSNPPGPQMASGPGPGPAAQKAPEPKPEPPVVTGDRETDRLLAGVADSNGHVLRTAADQLAGMRPNQHRAVVAKKLTEAIEAAQDANRPSLLRALGIWATDKEIPVLVRFISEGDTSSRNEALKAVAPLRDRRAVEPAIRGLASISTTWHAEQALLKMGPVAEDGLLAALDQPGNKDIRHPILRILKETGTEKSIPTLEAASQGDFAIKGSAKAALDAVRQRARK
jgi:hypothetical protein